MWRKKRPRLGGRRAETRSLGATLLLILCVAFGALAALAQEPAATSAGQAPATSSAPDATATEPATSTAVANEPAGTPSVPPPQTSQVDPYAQMFLSLCSGCHTIGGGQLTGPDLAPATHWQRADRRVAVKRMEKNVGPMTDEQVDGLTDFLGSPDLQAKLNAAREKRVEEMAATLEPGDPALGRKFFFGERALSGGGMPCFACHTAAGEGGNMAKDLTMVHTRLGEQSLLSATEKPAFPLMAAAYRNKPVTTQEAAHLAAFFKQTAAATPPALAAKPATEPLGLAHAGAGVLFMLVLGGVAFLARSRRAGVRARMVRDSLRR